MRCRSRKGRESEGGKSGEGGRAEWRDKCGTVGEVCGAPGENYSKYSTRCRSDQMGRKYLP